MRPAKPNDAKGIDVSHWQGTIDWHKVASSGVTFAFIKATESTGYTDPQFSQNYAGAKQAGILRGAYHFARPAASDAVTQAERYITSVDSTGGFDELPPMLDLEDHGELNAADLTNWVVSFVQYVFEKTGRQCLVYVSRYFANTYIETTSAVGKNPLFAAEYGVSEPGVFNVWKDWTFWQHNNSGSVGGIADKVDMDWFAGTVEQLRAFCGIKDIHSPAASGHESAPPTQGGNDVLVPELKQGDQGHVNAVKAIQGAVGAQPVDGVFGPETEGEVRAFQARNHLQVDGVVGPKTWGKILL